MLTSLIYKVSIPLVWSLLWQIKQIWGQILFQLGEDDAFLGGTHALEPGSRTSEVVNKQSGTNSASESPCGELTRSGTKQLQQEVSMLLHQVEIQEDHLDLKGYIQATFVVIHVQDG